MIFSQIAYAELFEIIIHLILIVSYLTTFN